MATRTDFFKDCNNPDQARKRYHTLAKKFHPDVGGSTEQMQELNRQYEVKLAQMSGKSYEKANSSEEYTYTYRAETETRIMDMIYALLNLKMERVKIEIIGTWVWISGETKRYKDLLGKSGLGLRFSGSRKMWYFTTTKRKRYHYKKSSMETLRYRYGSRVVQEDAV